MCKNCKNRKSQYDTVYGVSVSYCAVSLDIIGNPFRPNKQMLDCVDFVPSLRGRKNRNLPCGNL